MGAQPRARLYRQPPAPEAPKPALHKGKIIAHPGLGAGRIIEVSLDEKWIVVEFGERTVTLNVELSKFLHEKG